MRGIVCSGRSDESFLVLFAKKEQRFVLSQEAKTFVPLPSAARSFTPSRTTSP
jgi:hypothetical protein